MVSDGDAASQGQKSRATRGVKDERLWRAMPADLRLDAWNDDRTATQNARSVRWIRARFASST